MSRRNSQPNLAERRNSLYTVSTLINQYHSIELMEGTKEEKDWARDRLEKIIKQKSFLISDTMKGLVRSSLKSKELWESIREQYFQ